MKGDTDGRTTRSLMDKQIEQTPPNIGKLSTVVTSIMTRTKLTNLDSNDESSPPPKRRQNGLSVGQSGGFDSEASVINDQAFGKTENLSHGKKVVSRIYIIFHAFSMMGYMNELLICFSIFISWVQMRMMFLMSKTECKLGYCVFIYCSVVNEEKNWILR